MTSPSLTVFSTPFLLRQIISFRCELPTDLLQLAWHNGKPCPPAIVAVLTKNLRLLQHIYRHHRVQPDVAFYSFGGVWEQTLRYSFLAPAQWLHRRPEFRSRRLISKSAVKIIFEHSSSETIKWLATNNPSLRSKITREHLIKVGLRRLPGMMIWLAEYAGLTQFFVTAMNRAARVGDLDAVKLFHDRRTEGCTSKAMDKAASNGHLAVVKFLHENRPEGCTWRAMDGAACGGHLDVVRYLHEHRTEGCSHHTMDDAAVRDHLDVVRFLHENRHEGFTCMAMVGADCLKLDDMLRYLLDIKMENIHTSELSRAAARGDLDAVRSLVADESWGGHAHAIDRAAANGHVDIVRCIHECGYAYNLERCARWAVRGSHLPVIEYLLSVCVIGGCGELMEEVALWGDVDVVRYLHERYHPKCFAAEALKKAIFRKRDRVIAYLSEHCNSVAGKMV